MSATRMIWRLHIQGWFRWHRILGSFPLCPCFPDSKDTLNINILIRTVKHCLIFIEESIPEMGFNKVSMNLLINFPHNVVASSLFCLIFILFNWSCIGFNSFPYKLNRFDLSVFLCIKLYWCYSIIVWQPSFLQSSFFESMFAGLNLVMKIWFFCHFYSILILHCSLSHCQFWVDSSTITFNVSWIWIKD